VLSVLITGAAAILVVLVYRNEGFLKRGRRMTSTPRPPTPIERIARLESDNRQLRDLLHALHRKIDVFQHVIDNLQRAVAAAGSGESREPPPRPSHTAMPRLPAGGDRNGGGLVLAYNESLHTQPDVRAFVEARGLFGLGKSNGRDLLRYIEGDLQQCDFWGMRDEHRGEVFVLPGRKHYMNSSALARDDGRVGREALGPVFDITWGSVFSLMQAARGRETDGGVEILQPGRLEVPR
jgi:hypothetical protein